jgi:16S rRNA (cytosine967-C5)-methyltransferase
MSSSATLNRAARILALITPRDQASVVLRRELTARRDLSPAERRAIARTVMAYFRWLGWLDTAASSQSRIAAALELQTRFETNPAAIKPEALAARAVPEWLAGEMETIPAAWLRSLQREPALWIRVRLPFLESVPRELGDCVPAPLAWLAEPGPGSETPTAAAFRYGGPRDLFLTDCFQQGKFEIQDLASQLVGCACAPHPGETWWDACSGEGGKLLHLADLMRNKGLIWASDRSAHRLQVLRKRAARAAVFNFRAVPWNGGPQPPTKTRFDGILVDAPCSGVGTWQRHPHARWTASPSDVRELAAVQRQLLERVAGSLKPGGRLVYSVCTLTRSETTDVVAGFSAAHPELQSVPAFPTAGTQSSEITSHARNPSQAPASPDYSLQTSVTLWPQQLDANGMFIAAWRRQ